MKTNKPTETMKLFITSAALNSGGVKIKTTEFEAEKKGSTFKIDKDIANQNGRDRFIKVSKLMQVETKMHEFPGIYMYYVWHTADRELVAKHALLKKISDRINKDMVDITEIHAAWMNYIDSEIKTTSNK